MVLRVDGPKGDDYYNNPSKPVDGQNPKKGNVGMVPEGSVGNPGDKVKLENTQQKISVEAYELNYSNFGGRDKANTAALYASNTIDTVNDALTNLQKRYPGAQVDLEPFPDPNKFSKKQFGKDGAYNQWQQEVRAWRENSIQAINAYEDKSHVEVVNDAARDIKGAVFSAYASLKGGQLQLVNQMIELGIITKQGFDELAKKMDNNTAKVIKYVRQAANQIMANDNRNAAKIIDNTNQRALELHGHLDDNTFILSAQISDAAIALYNQAENNTYKINEHTTAETNRGIANTDEKAKQTQELDAAGKRIQNNLSNSSVIHKQETTNRMMSMYKTISQSTLPHDIKMQLADKVGDRAKDLYISASEMEALEDEIKRAIQVYEER